MPRLKYILCLFVHQNRTNRKSAALTLDKFHHDTADRRINRIGQLLLAIDRHIPKDLCKREKCWWKESCPVAASVVMGLPWKEFCSVII